MWWELALKCIKELKPSRKLSFAELKDVTCGDVPVTWSEEREYESSLNTKSLAVSVQMNVNALLNNIHS